MSTAGLLFRLLGDDVSLIPPSPGLNFTPFDINDPAIASADPSSLLVYSSQSVDRITVEVLSATAGDYPRTAAWWSRPLRCSDGSVASYPFVAPDGLVQVHTAPSASSGVFVLWGIADGPTITTAQYGAMGLLYDNATGPKGRAIRRTTDTELVTAALAGGDRAYGTSGFPVSHVSASKQRGHVMNVAVLDDAAGGAGAATQVFPGFDLTDPYEFICVGRVGTAAGNETVVFSVGRTSTPRLVDTVGF
jgi:hypothetical protein